MANIFVRIKTENGDIDIQKRYIDNLSSLSQSTPNPSEIIYGAIASSGTISILDPNGTIAGYIKDGTIPTKNVPIEIYLNGNIIQTHIVNYINECINGSVLKFDLTDKISKLSNMNYDGYNLTLNISAYTLIRECLENIYLNYDIDDMLSENMIYGDNIQGSIKDYLMSVIINYAYINQDNYELIINDICKMCQLSFYYNNSLPKFTSLRPIYIGETPSYIPKTKQYSDLHLPNILKNNYSTIETEYYKTSIKSEFGFNVFDSLIDVRNENLSPLMLSNTKWLSGVTTTDNPAVRIKQIYLGSPIGYHREGLMLCLKGLYYQGSIIINKTQENGLENILKINGDSPSDISVSVSYRKKEATVSTTKENPTYSDITIGEYSSIKEETSMIEDFFTYKSNITIDGETLGGTITLNSNNEEISIVEFDDYYNINYKILVGKEEMQLSGTKIGSSSSLYIDNWTGISHLYEPIQCSLSFNGNKQTIVFKKSLFKDGQLNGEINPVYLSNSDLMQDFTTYNDVPFYKIISQNILSDYKDGVADGKITVCCGDYFDKNGNKLKDFDSGEIFEVGDLIEFEQEPDRVFRITGRNFRYDGVPMLDLEFMEARPLQEE